MMLHLIQSSGKCRGGGEAHSAWGNSQAAVFLCTAVVLLSANFTAGYSIFFLPKKEMRSNKALGCKVDFTDSWGHRKENLCHTLEIR